MPITSSEAERSLLRRVKTYMRSVMTEERCLIAIQYRGRIAVDEVCYTFV